MLQKVQTDTSEEFGHQKKIHEKAMCECKTNIDSLTESVEAADRTIPNLKADLGGLESSSQILKAELDEEEAAAAEARKGELTAVALREKEQSANQARKDELDAALLAVEKAMMVFKSGSFLQDASALPKLRDLMTFRVIGEKHRRKVVALLENEQALQGNQIVLGVLEAIAEDLHKDYKEVIAAEKESAKKYFDLMKSKRSEGEENAKVVQEKKERHSEQQIKLVELKRELMKFETRRKEDGTFLTDLKKVCKEKVKVWDERSRTQTEELAAIADVIEMLDSDASHSLLSKTVGGSNGLSLLQIAGDWRDDSLDEISDALDDLPSSRQQGLQLISMELRSKRVDLSKVLKLIDQLLKNLAAEEENEEEKKKYCEEQQAGLRAKKQGLETKALQLEMELKNLKDGLDGIKQDIHEMKEGVAAIDESVQDATAQRKAEFKGLQEFQQETNDAIRLLTKAEQRLARAFKPKPGFLLQEVEENVAVQNSDVSAAGSKAVGIMMILNNLAKSLEKSLDDAAKDEDESQAEYELFMKESSTKRSEQSKGLTAKATTKASTETDLQMRLDLKASTEDALAGTGKLQAALMKECGWLLKNWDARIDARMREKYALQRIRRQLANAQGGAASFVQTRAEVRNLRGPS